MSGSMSRPMLRGSNCLCHNVLWMFLTIINVTEGILWGGCGVHFGNERGFNVGLILSYCRVRYFLPQPQTTMIFLTWGHDGHWYCCIHTVRPYWHIQVHALYLHIMGDAAGPWFGPIPLIGCQGTQKRLTKWWGWWQSGHYGNKGCHNNLWQCCCNRRCRRWWRESSVGIDVMMANTTISLVMTMTLQQQSQWQQRWQQL